MSNIDVDVLVGKLIDSLNNDPKKWYYDSYHYDRSSHTYGYTKHLLNKEVGINIELLWSPFIYTPYLNDNENIRLSLDRYNRGRLKKAIKRWFRWNRVSLNNKQIEETERDNKTIWQIIHKLENNNEKK